MLHSVVLKQVGNGAIIFGVAMTVIMFFMILLLQQYAASWGYFTTAGVYFMVTGVIAWIVGAGFEYRENKA